MIQSVLLFLAAYLLTNLLEIVPFSLLIKKPFIQKLLALFLINLITLPLLWITLPFFYQQYLVAFIIAEALVVLGETVLIKLLLDQTTFTSLKIAVIINVISAAVGFILF